MSRSALVTAAILGLIALVLLGIIAGRVGGIAIRNNVTRTHDISLSVVPLVAGEPVTVQWNSPDKLLERPVYLVVRDAAGETVVGAAGLTDQRSTIELPCSIAGAEASIVLRDAETAEVYASQEIDTVAAGACYSTVQPTLF